MVKKSEIGMARTVLIVAVAALALGSTGCGTSSGGTDEADIPLATEIVDADAGPALIDVVACLADECLPDRDGDGVPDIADPFPEDPDLPGMTDLDSVYAHSAQDLYRLDVKTDALEHIGGFGWPTAENDEQMTDIAIDRWGVIYGVTFRSLYTVEPRSGRCAFLAALPAISFNGLSFAPGASFGEERDVLLAVQQFGEWSRLDVSEGEVTVTKLGRYNGACSSGDMYSLVGFNTTAEATGTFAAVKDFVLGCADGNDEIARVDPTDGTVLETIVELPNDYSTVWGLAGWNQFAFAFDANTGHILAINVLDRTWRLLRQTDPPIEWWGAGTRTRFSSHGEF